MLSIHAREADISSKIYTRRWVIIKEDVKKEKKQKKQKRKEKKS